MKKILSILLTLSILVAFVGCSTRGESEAETFNVGALKGPTAISMLELFESEEKLDGITSVDYSVAGAPDEILAKLLSGELDAAAIPINLAPILYNKTEGEFQVASINTLGLLYIVENGSSITSLEDLKGKTIYAAGQGSTPEYILDYLLEENGLVVGEDVEVEYLTEHSEVSVKVISTEGAIGMLPEPFVTTTKVQSEGSVNVSLDLTQIWDETIEDTDIMMTAFVVNKEYASKYPNTVKAFLENYEKSSQNAIENIDETAALAVKYEILPSEEIAKQSIPNINITFLDAYEIQDEINKLYEIFLSYEPSSIGGSIPGEDFYFIK